MKFCPSCGKGWPADRPVCPNCLTPLVDDLSATVRCRHCGKEWPASMESCPDCLAELWVDAEPARSGHRPAFRDGPSCTLKRRGGGGSLVLRGSDELVEAEIHGAGGGAVPPLTCRDVEGTVLFALVPYQPVEDGLVAYDADRAPLATYLKTEAGMDVRDETSAPVAALRRIRGGYELVETGGAVLATCERIDVERGGYLDDEWSLQTGSQTLPLQPLAAVAMVLAAKVMYGRAYPVNVWEPPREERPEDRGWPYRL